MSDLLGTGKTETAGKVKQNENKGSLYLHYMEKRQTNGTSFEKTLSLKSEQYRSAKNRVFEQILR